MTSIIEKRLSLHKNLAKQQQFNSKLKLQLIQLQALANIGTTTCMIAHEINNLLTPIASYACLALKNPDDRSLAEKALQKTARNCQQVSEFMESMLAIANGQALDKKNAGLITLVEEIFTCLCRDFAKDGITVKIRIPEDLTVWAVPAQIQQILMNLILNARDAMLPRGGILAISAIDNDDHVQIEVSDTGHGIKPSDLNNIFKPFFTTKSDENLPAKTSGSGLGLAFCRRIIEEHGGLISVVSEPDKGSSFKITLPIENPKL